MPAHAWRTLPLLQRPGWVAALGRELPGPLAGNSGFRADPPGAPTLLQLSALTRLSALRLASGNWEADGYDVLEQLPALRRLVLHSTLRLPDCLGELTQVQDLVSVPSVRVCLGSTLAGRRPPPLAGVACLEAAFVVASTAAWLGPAATCSALPGCTCR